jgi:CheY-like chemotaxis protein
LHAPVTFSPADPGGAAGSLRFATQSAASGQIDVPLYGDGTRTGLYAATPSMSFIRVLNDGMATGPVPAGVPMTQETTIVNGGTTPQTVTSVQAPSGPFRATGLPSPGTVIKPGQSIPVQVTYTLVSSGTTTGSFTIDGSAGGHVRLYSEPGMGTTLTALLPVTEQAVAAETPEPRAHRGHGETVLVVEDEPALREVTRRILARNGYQVTAVGSGQEALTSLTRDLEHIDALLTDVVMPHMQGKELAEQVRALHPEARVMFMSGYSQGLLGAQGVLEPGVHLIEKPFSESALLARLHEILQPPG